MNGLLAFHAHPDDETLSMGGTLAKYAVAGLDVTVVTATGGEEGEVHNYDDPDDVKARLGDVRAKEIREALDILGVERHFFLGYRDSGMMGESSNTHESSFWSADFMEATNRLVRIIRQTRPAVMTAYDPYGGYGHPDHIQVHRIGTAAFFGAGDVGRFPLEDGEEPWEPQKLYWATFPRSAVRTMQQMQADKGLMTAEEAAAEPTAGSRDEDITTWIDVDGMQDRKEKAVLAHRTQIPADSWFRHMPDEMKQGFLGREPFTLVFSRVPCQPTADLLDGVTV